MEREEGQEFRSATIAKILGFIRERRYEQSERLPSERDFAEKFGSSRAAIREALAALEVMRVIERRPNSGIYLRSSGERSIEALIWQADSGIPFTASEIANVFEVRRMLEVQAVRLASARRAPEDIRTIRDILSKTRDRLDALHTIEAEDEAFHMAVFAATKNDILLRLVKSFYEMSRQRRRIYFSEQSRGLRAYDDHRMIFNAIENMQSDEAELRMSEHLSQAVEAWQILLGTSIEGPL
ncbi:FadR/GntR family transcriptional regulator [Methylobacterium gnaphalii]|uniref:GntR family transcriptional regulator n=1 Tax=Methylobacterium gnaphalii TaxID=1010610 RepID=A0A512JQT2_9HYPH|nr:FCD domain-containing protein [Methylobacterium gnaphalii]GEP12318.1 GntR family transcriptional regulator [Methylobacterium gnaphalii]GLS50899.1 GntR family transcriptional regulator [Methylobacterium gnaphalii]